MENREPAHLYSAACKGDVEAVRALLEHPFFDADAEAGINKPFSDVNEKVSWPTHETDGSTALVAASERGHLQVVELLCAQPDIDVNLARTDGATGLFLACCLGHSSVVPALLQSGADVNLAAETGASPVYIAAVNGHVDCLRPLLAVPSLQVNQTDDFGVS